MRSIEKKKRERNELTGTFRCGMSHHYLNQSLIKSNRPLAPFTRNEWRAFFSEPYIWPIRPLVETQEQCPVVTLLLDACIC